MIITDLSIGVLFLLTFFFWTRGLWKQNKKDLIFSGVTFIISIATYFYCYSFTILTGLPWIALLAYSVIGIIIILLKKKNLPSLKLSVSCILATLLMSGISLFAEQKLNSSANSLLVIAPYRHAGTWVFDDPGTGLQAEPFVAGIPEIIDAVVADANIQNAEKGFRLIFSAKPFPGHQTKILWRRRESAGNWYYSEKYDMEGWLCPALFKYFKRAPKEIYVKAEPK